MIKFSDTATPRINSSFTPPGSGQVFKPDGDSGSESFNSEFGGESFTGSLTFEFEVDLKEDTTQNF